MSAKHTPGPWDVVVRGWRSTFTITHPPFGVLGEVAEVYQEADARLIVAAPELLAENEALREANEAFGKRQEWWTERMFVLEQQRDALLEALREAVIEVTSVAGAVTPTTDAIINAQDCLKRAMAAIAKAEGRTE